MNQAIMQVPSVCILILQQAAFLAAEWEVVIQRKSAGGKINEISICVMLFCRHPSCEHVEQNAGVLRLAYKFFHNCHDSE